MYTRAKKILASEMMYALEKTEDEAEAYLDEILCAPRTRWPARPRLSPAPAHEPCRRSCAGPRLAASRAGSGERLGAGRPKAFVVLAGRPMLEWSLDALRAAGVRRVVVAVPPARRRRTRAAADCARRVVEGGDRARRRCARRWPRAGDAERGRGARRRAAAA